MEWIDALGRALRYIEDHLTDTALDTAAVARAAAYSPYYLQRMFYALTEQTLAEYIRQRRLSAAGQALRTARCTVLETALRFGYETPESFHKAFRRFHGIPPSAARRAGATLRYLSPFQIQVTLTGGTTMECTTETMPAMSVMGLARRFTDEAAFTEIPNFWDYYHAQGMDKTLCCYLGVCIEEPGEPDFTYMIARFCEADAPVPEGYVKHVLPAHTWAKFRTVGALPGSLQALNRRIYREWLPNNPAFVLADGCNVEMYHEGDMSAPDYVCEIWLPVKPKA